MKRILLFVLFTIFISGCVQTPTGSFLQAERITCTPSWQCSEWSSCSLKNGKWIQTRICNDLNNCNTTLNKPSESLDCESSLSYDVEIGKTFSQCNLSVVIDSALITRNLTYKNLDGSLIPLFSSPDKKIVLVHAGIENNFKDSIYTGSTDFYLTDQDEKNYDPKCPIDVSGKCIASDSWYLYSDYVLPSKKNSGYIMFLIPDNTSKIRIAYKMPYISYDCNGVKYLFWKI